MRFIYEREQVVLEDGAARYTIPKSDIARLLMRPGTRVLRFEKEGEVVSIPLATAIGEIEGYDLLPELLDEEKHP